MQKIQLITVCAFIHQNGKLLVAKRADTASFYPGRYELPGGKIEFGETLEEGLKREIKEEFQVDIKLQDIFEAFTYVNKHKHVVEVIYFAQIVDPSQEIILNAREHSAYKWIKDNEIDDCFEENDSEGQIAKRGFKFLKSSDRL